MVVFFDWVMCSGLDIYIYIYILMFINTLYNSHFLVDLFHELQKSLPFHLHISWPARPYTKGLWGIRALLYVLVGVVPLNSKDPVLECSMKCSRGTLSLL